MEKLISDFILQPFDLSEEPMLTTDASELTIWGVMLTKWAHDYFYEQKVQNANKNMFGAWWFINKSGTIFTRIKIYSSKWSSTMGISLQSTKSIKRSYEIVKMGSRVDIIFFWRLCRWKTNVILSSFFTFAISWERRKTCTVVVVFSSGAGSL